MTQEDKELLLKDLCARLPYKTLISIDGDDNRYRLEEICHAIIGIDTYKTTVENCNIEQVKPYLFPLSSMTEEIMDEIYNNTGVYDIGIDSPVHIEVGTTFEDLTKTPDILHKHHIDYRGLIPKGLAIDATGKNIY